MRNIVVFFVAVVIAATGCRVDTLTGVQTEEVVQRAGKREQPKMVPFEAESFGGLMAAPAPHADCPEGTVRSQGYGRGTASHLGLYNWTSWHCMDFSTTPPIFTRGHVKAFAANGDEVWFEYEGYMTGPNSWYMNEQIVGGTGRFENATGYAQGGGDILDDGSWRVYESGEISSVGSTK